MFIIVIHTALDSTGNLFDADMVAKTPLLYFLNLFLEIGILLRLEQTVQFNFSTRNITALLWFINNSISNITYIKTIR